MITYIILWLIFSFVSYFICRFLCISLHLFTNSFNAFCMNWPWATISAPIFIAISIEQSMYLILYTKVLLKPRHFNFFNILPAEIPYSKSCLTINLLASICKLILRVLLLNKNHLCLQKVTNHRNRLKIVLSND